MEEALNSRIFMMSLMGIAFLIFTGLAFSLLITYKILKKYSDIGDVIVRIDFDYELIMLDFSAGLSVFGLAAFSLRIQS